MSSAQDEPAARRRAGVRAWRVRSKEWDDHVGDMRELADTPGFRELRSRIVDLAAPTPEDRVLDIGSGTGLLTLTVAPLVRHVWALDTSPAMVGHLRARLAGRAITNVDVLIGSAVELPLAEESIDLVVSNYCFHHLTDEDKTRALAEVGRVLSPHGRLVIGDMMFRVGVTHRRDRAVIASKVVSILRRGPAGVLRVAKNVIRYLAGRWEHPADAEWWRRALVRGGFDQVVVETLEHEGGIAVARRPVD